MGHRGGVPDDIRHVGVAGDELQRPLLAAPADEDGRSARLHRRRHVAGLVDPVVGAGERGRLLGEHGPADLQRLLQPVQPFAGRREVEPEALVLDVVPGRPDPEDRPPRTDDVEGGDDLGQVRRVAVRHPGHHGAEPDPRGQRGRARRAACRSRASAGRAAQGRELVEVVHHPHRVEAGVLGRGRRGDDPVEEGGGCVAGGEVGDLQSEAHGPEPTGPTGRRARRHHPVRRRSQARATSPWAAWKGRMVGSPGGGGRSDRSTKKPRDRGEEDRGRRRVHRAGGTWRASRSSGGGPPSSTTEGAHATASKTAFPTAAWGQSTNTTPRRAEEHVVGAHVAVHERGARARLRPARLEFGQPARWARPTRRGLREASPWRRAPPIRRTCCGGTRPAASETAAGSG